MSATVSVAPTTNGQPLSPVEYVRALSPESKEEVFAALLLELIEINDGGYGLIPCNFAGQSLGYYVPPKAADERCERMMADLPPEVRKRLEEPIAPDFDPDVSIPAEKAWRIVKEESEYRE